MSYLKSTENNESFRYTIKNENDTSSSLFLTINESQNILLSLPEVDFDSSKTYYVKVKYRLRGNGNSTANNCSGIVLDNFTSQEHTLIKDFNSQTRFNNLKKIITKTFEINGVSGSRFTNLIYDSDYTDNQNIDLFYCKFYYIVEGFLHDINEIIFYEKNNLKNDFLISIFNKWQDGTSTESLKTISGGDDDLKTEYLKKKSVEVGDAYTIVITAKKNRREDVDLIGGLWFANSGIILCSFELDDSFKTYKKVVTIPEDIINHNYFCFFIDSDDMIIKDFKFVKGNATDFNFLKMTKNNQTYYSLLGYSSGKLKLTKDENIRYLRAGLSNYKYNESTKTYQELEDDFFEY